MNPLVRIIALLSLVFAIATVQAHGQSQNTETRMVVSVEGRGDFTIKLFTKEAPKTTARIIELVNKGFYNGQRFHRADKSPKPYLIQVGAPKSRTLDLSDPALMNDGSGQKLAYEETGISNDKMAVGLARLPDAKDSGDSQFYILLSPARFLNGKFAVFGTVITGMEVVQAIEKGDRITQVKIVKSSILSVH